MSSQSVIRAIIPNKLGLHARPAMAFVDTASAFQASITVKRCDGKGDPVDGKSIMQMMMLAATKGTELEVTCDGSDHAAAADALKGLIADGFGES